MTPTLISTDPHQPTPDLLFRSGAPAHRRHVLPRAKRRRVARRLAPLGLAAIALWVTGCDLASVKASVKDAVLTVTGSLNADTITLRLRAGDANTVEVDVGGDGSADFAFDRQTFTAITVDGAKGDDIIRIDHSNGAFTDTELTTLIGGPGNDTLIGDVGNETLAGGAGDDVLDGNQGADTLNGDDGNDTIQWDPGDASDTVNGGAGTDHLAFNASNASENIDIAANAGRVRLTRDVASVVMDIGTVEAIDLKALGGNDNVTVNDTTGTGLATVTTDLSATGGADDTLVDQVIVPAGSTIGHDGSAATANGFGAQVRVVNGAANDRIHVTGATAKDVVSIAGGAGPDAVSVVADGTDVDVLGATPGIFVQLTTVERLAVDLGAGDDTFNATGNLAALVTIDVNGGDGADTLLGGNGNDVISGGTGSDFLDGNQGADTLNGDDGDDTIQWDPGDGSDVVDGGNGTDRLAFNGANISENFDVSAVGDRIRFTRNVGTVVMDVGTVEAIDVKALGGNDVVTVNDTTGTGLATVTTDLSATGGVDDTLIDQVVVPAGSTIGSDGSSATANGFGAQVRVVNGAANDRIHVTGPNPADAVGIAGTAGADSVSVIADGTDVDVVGATPGVFVQLTTVETVRVSLGAGADTFNATGNLAALTSLQVDGGADADTLLGGNGNDVISGGTGDDFLDGNQGADTLNGDDGNDTIQWDPGDASDTVNGGNGADRLAFNGANISEVFDLAPVADHVRLTRNVATVTMDLDAIETVDLRALSGNDSITVNDLTGTDLTAVNVNLDVNGGTDAVTDHVVVNGTAGNDAITVADAGTAVEVRGLPATVHVAGADPTLDLLTVQGLAGADTITATPAASALMVLELLP